MNRAATAGSLTFYYRGVIIANGAINRTATGVATYL